ncbi:hypothetical protein [Pelosinus sp. sgz500959]|uniref:hypothetical protein n=1 Tax=Pelosinus sp. sgz500959 TaxID=3242472 RepID=UPI00367334C3
MKKSIATLVLSLLLMMSSVAFANLNDNKASMQTQYGDYRLVIDSDNQLWTKADWEGKGYKKAKAASYMYSFTRQGLRTQMEVLYNGDQPDSAVLIQRFTPDTGIQLKEFKLYFPEVYALIKSPKAQTFATYHSLSRQFQELQSPVKMGVVVKDLVDNKKVAFYSLIAFNIQDEGRLIKDINLINEDTYIKEFTIERVSRTVVRDSLESNKPEWQSIKNYF